MDFALDLANKTRLKRALVYVSMDPDLVGEHIESGGHVPRNRRKRAKVAIAESITVGLWE